MRNRHSRYGLFVILLAAGIFWHRGPARSSSDQLNDFAAPYVGARLLLAGQDPYSETRFTSAWVQSGGNTELLHSASITDTHPAYPLSTYVALFPLALLNWQDAVDAFRFLGVAGIALLALQAMRTIPMTFTDRIIALTCLLLLAPFHSAFGTGNISLLAVECCIAAVLCPAEWTRGVLIGFALCLKPQLAIFPICWWIAQKNWKVGLSAIGLFTATTGIAMLRLGNLVWYNDFSQNLNLFFSAGSPNDPSPLNPSRFELLNLQVIGFSVGLNHWWANVVAWSITLALILLIWFRRHREADLAGVSAICLSALLPMYARYYNAGLVFLFVICLLRQQRRTGILAAIPFSLPLGAGMRAIYGLPKHQITAVFIYSAETWALIILILLLTFQSYRPESPKIQLSLSDCAPEPRVALVGP